jgi:uncharacterized membrane protein YvbJ
LTFCSKCGNEIPNSGNYCPICGHETNSNVESIVKTQKQKEESWAWVLFPLFLGFLGGLIVYFGIKHDHPKQANQYMVLGLIVTVVGIVLWTIYFANYFSSLV